MTPPNWFNGHPRPTITTPFSPIVHTMGPTSPTSPFSPGGPGIPCGTKRQTWGTKWEGPEAVPSNSDTYLQARGANHPHEASHSIISFLPKEAWRSPASLSPICPLGGGQGKAQLGSVSGVGERLKAKVRIEVQGWDPVWRGSGLGLKLGMQVKHQRLAMKSRVESKFF